MLRRRRVALLVETSLIYGRRILEGITKYLRSHQRWSIFLDQREDQSPVPGWLEHWQGDGVICRVTNARLAEALARQKVPLIDLNEHLDIGLPRVSSDHLAIGHLGANHLLERGFRQFAFCGFSEQQWAAQRRDGFLAAVNAAGYPCTIFESRWSRRRSCPWEAEQAKIVGWLRSLPKPIGIMACNDSRGQHVLNACRLADILVPEHAAVVGVDNDELLCNLCDPPLSSVIPNAECIGCQAAAALDDLMAGRELPQREWLIAPLGIATRQSTDILAIDDPCIVAALKFIRDGACEGVTVQDVVNHVAMSRSLLDRGFQKYLGRTPQAELRQVQIKRVRELLLETDLSLTQIARLAGYEHPEYMNVVFKRETGQTPGQFRRQAHLK
jgi:LacI family transcriptional regulator